MTGTARGRRTKRFMDRIRRKVMALFHRAERKADRAGRRVQDAAEVVGETAVDLAHGPDPASE
jgi:hypothetical protein